MTRIASLLLFAALLAPLGARAADTAPQTRSVEAPFEDVLAELNDAVINRGLVIDYTGHVDAMLARTADVASTQGASPYRNAKYMQFCSAELTHAAVAADPANLSICPYLVFLYETEAEPGTVHVGYRRAVTGASEASQAAGARINEYLQKIVDEVADASY